MSAKLRVWHRPNQIKWLARLFHYIEMLDKRLRLLIRHYFHPSNTPVFVEGPSFNKRFDNVTDLGCRSQLMSKDINDVNNFSRYLSILHIQYQNWQLNHAVL